MPVIRNTAALFCTLCTVLSAPAGAEMLLAEYRADEQPAFNLPAPSGPTDARRMTLESRVVGESLEMGSLWLDYRFSESLSAEQGPGLSLATTLGQRFQFRPGHVTDVYYSWNLSAPEDAIIAPAGGGFHFRSGVGHTLDVLDSRLALRLGYEYEHGALDAFSEDASAHYLGMTGLWRFGGRYEASVGADYGFLFYPQYLGANDLSGEQLRLRALLQRSFGESLSGRLRYSFADEEFDDPTYSLRRHSLGLDLQYRY